MTPWQGLWTLNANVVSHAIFCKYIEGRPWQGLWTLHANVDSRSRSFFYAAGCYTTPLITTGNVHPHPLTSPLLAAEFALLVIRGC
ncbi:MAG: hypothetical protein Q8R90_09085, partial [Bacteroidales bacterium]|nr:hypothetical protein [Bacteroidales bacterium]